MASLRELHVSVCPSASKEEDTAEGGLGGDCVCAMPCGCSQASKAASWTGHRIRVEAVLTIADL